jgi:YD repeat-containing protein
LYTYEGSSRRLATETYPNGQTVSYGYGSAQQDFDLRRITNEVNGVLLSEFIYDRDVAAHRITSWTQTASGQPSATYTFDYDDTNQLTSSTLSISGQPDQVTSYSYDVAGNRLTQQSGGTGSSYSYNALNQLTDIIGATPPPVTYQWDAQDRLVEATVGSTAVKLGYDGLSRLVSELVSNNGSTVAERRYVWDGHEIVAETDAGGSRTKLFFAQGMRIDSGATAGAYYYSRDHLDRFGSSSTAPGQCERDMRIRHKEFERS